ncbi:uncharacterized protein LOC111124902 isoform X2 [Crassostrea virginica]
MSAEALVYQLLPFHLLFSFKDVFSLPSTTRFTPVGMKADQEVTLQCTVPPSYDLPVQRAWTCYPEAKTYRKTRKPFLTIQTLEESDQANCCCQTDSNCLKITGRYMLCDRPMLTTNPSTSLVAGRSFILQCTFPCVGNRSIQWSWVCALKNLSLGNLPHEIYNTETSSQLILKAEAWINDLSCHCVASSLKHTSKSREEKLTVYYVPLDFPELHNKTPVQVEENWPVTLRCDVTSDSNPLLVWSWYCGEVLMESGVIYGGTWSELTFLASRTFHQRACYCQLQSESDKVFYNKTSQNLFIVVQSRKTCISVPVFASVISMFLVVLVIISVVFFLRVLKQRPLSLRIPSCRCRCFGNIIKASPHSVEPPQPKLRQETDRTISLIDEHSYEAVQPPRKRAQRVEPPQPKLRQETDRTISLIDEHSYEAVQPPRKRAQRGRQKRRALVYENVHL